jgi:hypothetical protein
MVSSLRQVEFTLVALLAESKFFKLLIFRPIPFSLRARPYKGVRDAAGLTNMFFEDSCL